MDRKIPPRRRDTDHRKAHSLTRLTFVLIPGAGGSVWYWHLVEAQLRARRHHVVAVSLPAADDTAGLREYADAVVRAIGDLGQTNVVLVAQSLAGFTVPLVCQRVPVSLVVLVNAMIPESGETPGDWWRHTGYAEAKRQKNVRDDRPADAQFDPLIDFFHDVPRRVVNEALAKGPPRQSDTVFTTPCAFDRWPDVPTRVLVARDDRFFPAEFQRRVAQERLGITPDEMPGGHLVGLSRPRELAERLDAYAVGLRLYEQRSGQRPKSGRTG
jgi:pimeloyl-ACP methyl ester carboxylesterase